MRNEKTWGKAGKTSKLLIISSLATLLVAGLFLYTATVGSIADTTPTDPEDIAALAQAEADVDAAIQAAKGSDKTETCLSDVHINGVDLTANIIDVLADGTSYLDGTFYIIDNEDSSLTEFQVSSVDGNAGTSVANLLDCGHPEGYDMYLRTNLSGTGTNGNPYPVSLVGAEADAPRPGYHLQGDVDLTGKYFGTNTTAGILRRLYDEGANEYAFSNVSGHGDSNPNRKESYLSDNSITFVGTTNTTLKDTSAGDTVTYRFDLRTGAGAIGSTRNERGAFGNGFIFGIDVKNSTDQEEWDVSSADDITLSAGGKWVKGKYDDLILQDGGIEAKDMKVSSGVTFVEFEPRNNDENAIEASANGLSNGPDFYYQAVDKDGNPVTFGFDTATITLEMVRDDTNSDGDICVYYLGTGVWDNEKTSGDPNDLLGVNGEPAVFRDDTADTLLVGARVIRDCIALS